jgi:hypothetical protein
MEEAECNANVVFRHMKEKQLGDKNGGKGGVPSPTKATSPTVSVLMFNDDIYVDLLLIFSL